MTYEYICPLCSKVELITKPMADAEDMEYCESCGEELTRVYSSAPSIWTADGIK